MFRTKVLFMKMNSTFGHYLFHHISTYSPSYLLDTPSSFRGVMLPKTQSHGYTMTDN